MFKKIAQLLTMRRFKRQYRQIEMPEGWKDDPQVIAQMNETRARQDKLHKEVGISTINAILSADEKKIKRNLYNHAPTPPETFPPAEEK